MATVFTEYVHAYFRGHSPRYAVLGDSGDSERQTGLPGGCVSGFQQGQPSDVFHDPLYHGRALNSKLATRPLSLRAVRATEGIGTGLGIVVATV